MKDEFDVAGAYVKLADLVGNLLLFTPTEYVDLARDENGVVLKGTDGDPIGGGMVTQYGRKDYVVTDIVVLDAEDGPEVYTDQSILQGGLVGRLKRKVPTQTKLLGVLTVGDVRVRGQKPPYELSAPTDEQKQMARDYLAGRTVEAATAKDQPQDAGDPWATGS